MTLDGKIPLAVKSWIWAESGIAVAMPKNTKHGIFIAASLDGPIECGKRLRGSSDLPSVSTPWGFGKAGARQSPCGRPDIPYPFQGRF